MSAVPTSPAGRCTTSRARRSIRTGSMPRRRAAGSARRCSARTTAARPGSRSATSSTTTAIPGTHQWYDGTQHPWEFTRVWHLEPSLTDPDTVYAGVEDAALFRSTDGGQTWHELSGLARSQGQPLAARRRRHVPAHDHPRSERPQPHLRRHLGRGRVPHRRRRPDVAADQPGPEVPVRASRPGCRSRPLRAQHRHASLAPRHALHAEALGRDAHRQRRRVLARGQRQSADRLRLPDRRPRPRAGDDLRRADQERLRALSRPKASCASIAAAPAATNGKR